MVTGDAVTPSCPAGPKDQPGGVSNGSDVLTSAVSKRAATVRLDDQVLNAVRREAERSGRSEDQIVETAVRQYVGPSVLDRFRERNRLDEDEAMAIEEVAGHYAWRFPSPGKLRPASSNDRSCSVSVPVTAWNRASRGGHWRTAFWQGRAVIDTRLAKPSDQNYDI